MDAQQSNQKPQLPLLAQHQRSNRLCHRLQFGRMIRHILIRASNPSKNSVSASVIYYSPSKS
jgi:hypothetical protein